MEKRGKSKKMVEKQCELEAWIMLIYELLGIFFFNKLVNRQYHDENAVSEILWNTFDNITDGWHMWIYVAL